MSHTKYLAITALGVMGLLAACGSSAPPAEEAVPAVVVDVVEEAPAEAVQVEEIETEPLPLESVPVAATATPLPTATPTSAPTPEIVEEEIGPTSEQTELLASLADRGVPPELNNEVWLNSEPLKLADLHGQVVIVEFWTFGCFNCTNVIPYLRQWHNDYSDEGLVIIGVHTPEFDYESQIPNVEAALVDLDVQYPVAIDNDWVAWRSYKPQYGQRYWPTKYFIDKAGHVRHIHIGEGGYEQQELIIQALLAEKI